MQSFVSMETIVIFVVLIVAIAVAALVVRKLPAKAGAILPDGDTESSSDPVPYRKAQHLLTPAEQRFHAALTEALPVFAHLSGKSPPLVLMKVRLADILQVDEHLLATDSAGATPQEARKGRNRAWRSSQNRIDRKHADFVMVAPVVARERAFEPLLIIELDDASHDREDRRTRDDFVDRACAAARLPILHIRATNTYEPARIAEQIHRALAAP